MSSTEVGHRTWKGWKMQGQTVKHREDCGRVFSRLDPSCERCQELAAGAEARTWGHSGNDSFAERSYRERRRTANQLRRIVEGPEFIR